MRKAWVTRYDLDKVYFMSEYNKAIAHGKQNISIQGVKEQLRELEQEKKNYFDKVADIVNPERDTEQAKYQQYEKWTVIEKKIKHFEIALILATILYVAFEKYFPTYFVLFGFILVAFVLFIGPITFIISKIAKHSYGMLYNRYIQSIADKVNSLGSSFERTSAGYYDTIDSLYLGSLDPAHKEMVLIRRQQAMHNQEMLRLEKKRQKAENQFLTEQQRTRQATEELLQIEKERERRYRGW